MKATPDGRGYWLVDQKGNVFTFGDAKWRGSTGHKPPGQPIVGMVATPSGNGYWLVGRSGHVFNFGDAKFSGSTGGSGLTQPIVAISPVQ